LKGNIKEKWKYNRERKYQYMKSMYQDEIYVERVVQEKERNKGMKNVENENNKKRII